MLEQIHLLLTLHVRDGVRADGVRGRRLLALSGGATFVPVLPAEEGTPRGCGQTPAGAHLLLPVGNAQPTLELLLQPLFFFLPPCKIVEKLEVVPHIQTHLDHAKC